MFRRDYARPPTAFAWAPAALRSSHPLAVRDRHSGAFHAAARVIFPNPLTGQRKPAAEKLLKPRQPVPTLLLSEGRHGADALPARFPGGPNTSLDARMDDMRNLDLSP